MGIVVGKKPCRHCGGFERYVRSNGQNKGCVACTKAATKKKRDVAFYGVSYDAKQVDRRRAIEDAQERMRAKELA